MKRQQTRGPRRATIRPTVGLIVEGDTEFLAFPYLHTKNLLTNCPPLKPTNLKGVGSDLSPTAIAKMVAPKVVAHFAAGRTKVIVCIDLEDRDECPGNFATLIHKGLQEILANKQHSSNNVHIVILNRTFEAILLAGSKSLHRKGLFKKAHIGHSFEGKMGKQNHKGIVELTELLGREYRKTSDGPRLFEKLDLSEAREFQSGGQGSKSFDKLLRTLES